MEEKDKITIMLEEYRTLRAELLQRNTIMYQIYAISGTIGAATSVIMIQYHAYLAGLVIILALGIWITLTTSIIRYDSRAASTRIRQIEAEINRRSQDTLLCWETQYGLHAAGLRSRIKSALEPARRFFIGLRKSL